MASGLCDERLMLKLLNLHLHLFRSCMHSQVHGHRQSHVSHIVSCHADGPFCLQLHCCQASFETFAHLQNHGSAWQKRMAGFRERCLKYHCGLGVDLQSEPAIPSCRRLSQRQGAMAHCMLIHGKAPCLMHLETQVLTASCSGTSYGEFVRWHHP